MAIAATILSCTKEQDSVRTLMPAGSERVCATAADFVCGDELTKTAIAQEGAEAPRFAWEEGDVIGIIPMNGKTVQSNYEVSEISSDPREAVFDGGVWALKEGKEYAAYYPFKEEIVRSGNSLDFSFLGQTQAVNDTLGHLGSYDYMYAGSAVPAAGAVTFQFKHLISLVRLQLPVPVTDTYKSVSLESDAAWFASKASLQLSDGTTTGSDCLSEFTLNLDNISVSAGKVLTVWFAMLPTSSLKDKELVVKLRGVTTIATASVTIKSEFKAGSAYSYSCAPVLSGPESVDLGLSVKWATCNLGATGPADYGSYYQWAGIDAVDDLSFYLDWGNCAYQTGSVSSSGWTKYIPAEKTSYWAGEGAPDNKLTLDPEDDVAHVAFGGSWRMPTDDEWTELMNDCDWEWVNDYNGLGVAGCIVTSEKPGYTDKSIFLPAAGFRSYDLLFVAGTTGYYWSSSLNEGTPSSAYNLNFSNSVGLGNYGRCFGLSIRPVKE